MKDLSAKAYKIGEHPTDGIGAYFFDPTDNRVWYLGANSRYVNMGSVDRFKPDKFAVKLNASGLNLMSRKVNPRKGKMPSALAKYWATHKRKKRTKKDSLGHRIVLAKRRRAIAGLQSVDRLFGRENAKQRKKLSSRVIRATNPRASYHLALKTKQGARLYYAGADKFSHLKKAVAFSSLDAVKITARRLLKNFPALKRYAMISVPA